MLQLYPAEMCRGHNDQVEKYLAKFEKCVEEIDGKLHTGKDTTTIDPPHTHTHTRTHTHTLQATW